MAVMDRLLAALFGGGRNVVSDVAEVFRPNAEGQAKRDHEAVADALAQFAAEFGARRSWWDALIDGLNRLPRPLMAFGTIALFAAAMTDPVWFAARMAGLQAVPEPLWYLLGAIVGFFFGARELHKAREVRVPSPDRIRATVEAIRQIEAVGQPEPVPGARMLDGDDPEDNPALRDMLAEGDRP